MLEVQMGQMNIRWIPTFLLISYIKTQVPYLLAEMRIFLRTKSNENLPEYCLIVYLSYARSSDGANEYRVDPNIPAYIISCIKTQVP